MRLPPALARPPRPDDAPAADASSDAELLAAFAAGDPRAFERLYARHEATLYRFVRRLLGREAAREADEVFQDTWMRAIQARDGWRSDHAGGASFRTWLFTIAHHRAIDRLRVAGRELPPPVTDDDTPWEPAETPWAQWPGAADGPTAPDEQAFWRAAGQRLLDCLEELPLPQKAAFLMHHEDGLAVGDLARALDCGFETAKTRLRYAMSKLRTCMGAYLPAATLTEPR
jgi:RNA polymerase sigma-70 factor (ECF subfamily)